MLQASALSIGVQASVSSLFVPAVLSRICSTSQPDVYKFVIGQNHFWYSYCWPLNCTVRDPGLGLTCLGTPATTLCVDTHVSQTFQSDMQTAANSCRVTELGTISKLRW